MLNHVSGAQNRFLLVYGTATGQSQAIAEDIAEKASSFGMVADLFSLEDTGIKFNIEKEKCVVFITSSTGDGEPPPNAEKFMRRIKKRTLGCDYLAHMHYTLLGLGDSNYSNFCRCPRDLDNRLEALGAQRFYSTGLADDGVGLEIVIDPWLEGLYPALQKFLGVSGAANVSLTETVQSLSLFPGREKLPKWKIENADKTSQSLINGNNKTKTPTSEGVTEGDEHIKSSNVNNMISSNSNSVDTTETVTNSIDDLNINFVESQLNNIDCLTPKLNSVSLLDSKTNGKSELSSKLDEVSQLGSKLDEVSQLGSKLDEVSQLGSKLDEVSQLDYKLDREAEKSQCSPNLILSQINNFSHECKDVTTLTKQSHISENYINSSNSVADNILQETPSIPASLSNLLSLSTPLTQPSPSLSGQTLTIPTLPPSFLSGCFKDDSIQLSSLSYQNGCKLPCASSDIFTVQILSARVLTAPDAVKKTLLLRLNLEGHDITYSPGDAVSVICPNNASEVDLLLMRLDLLERADCVLTLSIIPETQKRRAVIPAHIHPVCTTRHIFTTCLNIREPPSKAFIRALIEYTHNEHDKRRLQELCSKEGSVEYTKFVREPNISFLDFLYAFPSCKPPLETVLEHLPRLQPRPYSICSCLSASPSCLDIVFNVIEIPFDEQQGHFYPRRGVCTGWLNDITSALQSNSNKDIVQISIFQRTNQNFRPSDDISKPLIMIGPGTGVAPFIGFIQERSHKKNLMKAGQTIGDSWLFYGCKNKDKDFLFREELHKFETTGILTRLCVAFSRDKHIETPTGDDCVPFPRYVQDLLLANSQEISSLLVESEAFVYVCGDAKNMAKDVNKALEDILQKVNGLTVDDAHMFMMKKRIHKTYFEDVWH